MAFRAFDCNSQSSQIEQYSLLDPEPCGNMEKVHAIERELYGEIVQIKKERFKFNILFQILHFIYYKMIQFIVLL